tara:strand:- start:1587 stop:1769 length:183 start_codon:yes stop_codon:yes gene_type:complete
MYKKLKQKPKPAAGRQLKLPISTKQEVKNECMATINTEESKKCIKKQKKINIENIFNKKK